MSAAKYTIMLTNAGRNPIALIKVLREIVPAWGSKGSKEACDRVAFNPGHRELVVTNAEPALAERILEQIAAAGGAAVKVASSQVMKTHFTKGNPSVEGLPICNSKADAVDVTVEPARVTCLRCKQLILQTIKLTDVDLSKEKKVLLSINEADDEITPDWRRLYTPEHAEMDLIGFEFKGPGWYFLDEDVILVIPSQQAGLYAFWVYNNRNPVEGFNQIANAPVRVAPQEVESE